jgi:hypothetical protein
VAPPVGSAELPRFRAGHLALKGRSMITAAASPNPRIGSILLKITAADSKPPQPLRLSLKFVRLASEGKSATRPQGPHGLRFFLGGVGVPEQLAALDVPAGEYSELALIWSRIEFFDRERKAWLPVDLAPSAASTIHGSFVVFPDRSRELRVRLDTAALVDPKRIAGAIHSADTAEEASHARISAGEAVSLRLQLRAANFAPAYEFELAGRPDAFPDGATGVLRSAEGERFPALFRGQTALGPAVHVATSAAPAEPVELTVAYDVEWLRSARHRPEDIIVLQLDDAMRLYREHRPFRRDDSAHTVTIRVASSSYFFAGTPGVRLDYPDFFTNNRGESFLLVRPATLTLSGQADDPAARVTTQPGGTGWSEFGWFHFSGIPLAPRGDTHVSLVAEVEGMAPHHISLLVRGPAPSKTVVSTSHLCGTGMTIQRDETPFISAVINQRDWRQSNVAIQPILEPWQRSFNRHGPYVYWWNVPGNRWDWIPLLPDFYLENAVARATIETFNRVTDGSRIELDGGFPEPTRALQSLDKFLAESPDDLTKAIVGGVLGESGAGGLLGFLSQDYGAAGISITPQIPILNDEEQDGDIVAAFVAANGMEDERAAASGIRPLLREIYSQRIAQGENDRSQRGYSQVLAGTLFYTEAGTDNVVNREEVARAIWCPGVRMRRNPMTGQATILALGVLSDDEDGVPRTSLLLFERLGPDDWLRHFVSVEHQVIDADFAFDSDGEPHVIASVVRTTANQARLVEFSRVEDNWIAAEIHWKIPQSPDVIDAGIWPRIEIAPSGKRVIAFSLSLLGPAIRLLAVRGEEQWEARLLDIGSMSDLTGSLTLAERDDRFEGDIPGQSGYSAAAWAPSLALLDDQTVGYAYCNGVLKLERINIDTLTRETSRIDVDRMIGFWPCVAARPNGAVALSYKDRHGPNEQTRDGTDSLCFFSSDHNNSVPKSGLFTETPPTHLNSVPAFIGGYAPHRPLDRTTLIGPEDFGPETLVIILLLLAANIRRIQSGETTFQEVIQGFVDGIVERKQPRSLVDSILLHRKFHLSIIEGGPERILWHHAFQYFRSHREFNHMVDGLHPLPRAVQVTIDNNSYPDEEIERIDIMLLGPLAQLNGDFTAALDMGSMPQDLFDTLVNVHGFRFSGQSNLRVRRISEPEERPEDPGTHWLIIDPNPWNSEVLLFPDAANNRQDPVDTRMPVSQRYHLRRDATEYTVSVEPIITITDRERFQDNDGNFAPLHISQFWWDIFLREISDELIGALPDVAGSFAPANRVSASNVKLYPIVPVSHPKDQQGGLRFRLMIGRMAASGRDPDNLDAAFSAYTSEPSFVDMIGAPFVNQYGQLDWFIRDVDLRQGHFEVDIQDWGELDFLRIIVPFIPLLGGLSILAGNAIFEDIAEGEVNRRNALPSLPEFQNVLLRRFQDWLRQRLQEPTSPLEAVFLDGWYLNFWRRRDLDPAPLTGLDVLPTTLRFSPVDIGDPPPLRNLLVHNSNNGPAILNEVRFDAPSADFALVDVPPLPALVSPGNALVVGVQFQPPAVPDTREALVVVRYNTDQHLRIQVTAATQVPPSPLLNLPRFRRLQFGVVYGGATERLDVLAQNYGGGSLVIAAVNIAAETGSGGVFSVDTALPLRIPFGGMANLTFAYTPPANANAIHHARATIVSNDPGEPDANFELTGAAAVAALLVQPEDIAFNPSPLAAALPAGLGSSRAINLYNGGVAALTVFGNSFSVLQDDGQVSPHFTVLDSTQAPLANNDVVIQPGGWFGLSVLFRPQTAGDHVAHVTIGSTDVNRPAVNVPITGTGVA